MSQQSISGPTPNPNLPLITTLAGEAGPDVLRADPDILWRIGHTYGVLSKSAPTPNDATWKGRAKAYLGMITSSPEMTDTYASMVVDNAREMHDQFMQARTDSLTRMPNRLAWIEDLRHTIRWAASPRRLEGEREGLWIPREPKRGFAIGIIDLDFFKDVNDILGHDFGDVVLAEFGGELSGMIRQSIGGRRQEPPRDKPDRRASAYPDFNTIYRLGGDEWAVILRLHEQWRAFGAGRRGQMSKSIADVAAATIERLETDINAALVRVNTKIKAECERRGLDLENYPPDITASFGWQVNNGHTEGDLVRDADVKMYQRKAQGKGEIAARARERLKPDEVLALRDVVRALSQQGFATYRRVIEPLVALLGQSRNELLQEDDE